MGFKARLKPQNLHEHYYLGKFGYNGLIYEAGAPESDVSDSDAAFLRTVRERDGDPHSPLAFHVWDPSIEPAPADMTFVPKKKGEGITAADLRGEFLSRSEVDALIAKAVRDAMANVTAQMAAAAVPSGPAAPPAAVVEARHVETPVAAASEPEKSAEAPVAQAPEPPTSIPEQNAMKLDRMFPQLAHKGGRK